MAATLNTFLHGFNSKFEPEVRQHLKNVYGCLALSTIAAAAGASVHMYTSILQAGLLTSVVAIIMFFLLISTPDNGKNTGQRMGYLLGFAALTGLGLGPLLEVVISLNPSIVVTALLVTSAVFASFTLCSLFAERGSYLFLGGTLITLMSSLMLMGLANLLIGSRLIWQAQMWFGLLIMCGFVLYDTQAIIEKRRLGNKDFITHSMDLFVDFISIFRRVLIILTQKEEDQRRKKRE